MMRGSARPAAERHAQAKSDAELMLELASGQLGALGELYDRYHSPLRGFIARATRDAHDVDDLLHATFLAAAESAAREVEADAVLVSASHASVRPLLRKRGYLPLPGNVHFMVRVPPGGPTLPTTGDRFWLTRGDSEADEAF